MVRACLSSSRLLRSHPTALRETSTTGSTTRQGTTGSTASLRDRVTAAAFVTARRSSSAPIVKLSPFSSLPSIFVFASLFPSLHSSPPTDLPSKATPWDCRTTSLFQKSRVASLCTVRSRFSPAKSGMADSATPADAVPPQVAPAEPAAAYEAERPAEGGEGSTAGEAEKAEAEEALVAAENAAKKAKRDYELSAEPDSIPAASPAAPAAYKLRQPHSVLFKEASAYLLGEEGCVLVLQRGDLTRWFVDGRTDAIVNAANERMLGGGGVDGAIHRAAGPGLVRECKAVPEVGRGVRCPTGQAVRTGAAELPVKHVVHTVGPIYESAERSEPLLQSSYVRSMEEARKAGVKFIAFPAVSCGIYGYPFPDAAQVSLKALQATCASFSEVHFILFNDEGMEAYEGAAKELLQPLEVQVEG
ncbi:hypothetical protein CLOM_g3937 [Closterium sp. NIES-68]|nr:hypothetical protein CLOM_g3937 [Closterium sp. NIES-68]GJP66766.1 hypothetical protein CLOP_g23673 [Closterium sp. NIES-67]